MNNKTQYLCEAALTAAVYTALGLIFMPISFGPVQCRISEMLVVLPAFIPAALPGVTLGCLLTNILGGAILPDIIFGTFATFAGAVFTCCLTRNRTAEVLAAKRASGLFRACTVLPPVISNTVIVPFVLKYAYGFEDALYFMFVTVGIGEAISIGIAGNLLITVMCRTGVVNMIRSER